MATRPLLRDASNSRTTAIRASVAAAGLGVALASAAWIDPAAWRTYLVFFALAFAFSFVWLDSDAPTSVPHMATATAFVYIAGFPILFVELLARCTAYPVMFAAARRGWITLPRPLRPLVVDDPVRARAARLDLAAMLGLATVGSAVRVAVVHLARGAGIESPIALIAVGEPMAYAVMGGLSAVLPLPTSDFVVAAPHRLPIDDERVDVIFSAVFIVPFLVVLINYGYLEHGLIGAAALSVATLAPHALVQLVNGRRHLLDEHRLALECMNATLAWKNTQIQTFSFALAHDVRMPMSAINTTATLVLDKHGGHLSPAAQMELRTIIRLARRTEAMAVDLLRMVRIVWEPEPVGMVDLGAIAAEALEELRSHIVARRVRVDVMTPLPVVPGQATKLRHVIGNLIGNAIRFVPEGTGTVEVSATPEDGAVILSVRDNGIGIPAEYHEAIFQMFRRVPTGNGDEGGSGMGLAIVKRIVEGHGGEVSVESAPGLGSVFRVRLPAG